MPGTYNPVFIGAGSTQKVSIIMPNGYTYQEFLSSLISIFYLIMEINIYAQTKEQIEQTYFFNFSEAQGNLKTDLIPYIEDPFQVQPNMNVVFKNQQYLINGEIALSFALNANENIQIILNTIIFNPKDLLKNLKTAKRGFLFISEIQNYLAKYRDLINEDTEKVPREIDITHNFEPRTFELISSPNLKS